MKYLIALLGALLWANTATAIGPWNRECEGETPCLLGDRSYHVRAPDDWDGVTPLPVMLHFHGWQRQGTLIVQHQRISGATHRRGVLLVAPNGLGRSWDFWHAGTDDVGFARAVLQDVKERYPVLADQVFVSGYSWGSNMAWRFVCEDGADVAALLAISGTLSQTEDCATAPREVRQVYGLNDQVLDYPYGPNGELDYPVYLWREKFGCDTGAPQGLWNARDFLTFERTTWDCSGGRVSLDIHPGGHFIPHGWIARQLDELLGLPNSYP
ncbi:polyhydroxybutyrate depolymerase [uncultured Roseobacter sp.]|uniref:alpha/beta hydrolase family esterase n=1 Tax=uncultured Roseobacter sp. TaxID=114847 RepID=UPI002610C367|nr:polyhydroxybutyrate depolymerase [uncultured Roseobacter sp.]